MLKKLFTPAFIFAAAVFFWNLYDAYGCLFNADCGWRQNASTAADESFRLFYLIFNLLLATALLIFMLVHIRSVRARHIQPIAPKPHAPFRHYGSKSKKQKKRQKPSSPNTHH